MRSVNTISHNKINIELLSGCKKAIRDVLPDAEVILYGSRARGDAKNYSDYDLLIITNEQEDIKQEERIISNIYPIELESGEVISFIIYNRQKWESNLYKAMPFHKNIEQDGVLL